MKKTNDIHYSVTRKDAKGQTWKINIRLNDECKNGYENFAITGEAWEAGKPCTHRYSLGSGAMGDKIAEAFPEYAIFNQLHLCDFAGAPMYAVANGFYHIKQWEADVFCKYFSCDIKQYNLLSLAETIREFAAMIAIAQIPATWEARAKAAIAKLEELTGEVFKSTAARRHYTAPGQSEINRVKEMLDNGYYLPENREARAKAKYDAAVEEKKAAILEDYNNTIGKASDTKEIALLILEVFGPAFDNWIYYDHSHTLKFNWRDYDKVKATSEQVEAFVKHMQEQPEYSSYWATLIQTISLDGK
jgi:hypothetical protein